MKPWNKYRCISSFFCKLLKIPYIHYSIIPATAFISIWFQRFLAF